MSTTTGQLYGAGINDYGELGHTPAGDVHEPRLIEGLSMAKDHLLCCGDACSFIVLDGRVLAAGLFVHSPRHIVSDAHTQRPSSTPTKPAHTQSTNAHTQTQTPRHSNTHDPCVLAGNNAAGLLGLGESKTKRARLVMMLQSRLARIKYRKLVNGDILQEQFYTVAPIRVFGSHVLRCILRCLGRSSNGIVPRSTRAKVRPLVIYLRVGLPHAYSDISHLRFLH